MSDDSYARSQREAVKPVKCIGGAGCWVEHGGREFLTPAQGTPRCLGCNDKLRIARWRPPGYLRIPTDLRSKVK
jgi:hypothetical protein